MDRPDGPHSFSLHKISRIKEKGGFSRSGQRLTIRCFHEHLFVFFIILPHNEISTSFSLIYFEFSRVFFSQLKKTIHKNSLQNPFEDNIILEVGGLFFLKTKFIQDRENKIFERQVNLLDYLTRTSEEDSLEGTNETMIYLTLA